MRVLRLLPVPLLISVLPANTLPGQLPMRPIPPASEHRLSVDAYFSRQRVAASDTRRELDGGGARVTWALAPTEGAERSRLAEHLSVGGFMSVTRDQVPGARAMIRSTLVAAALDIRPLRAPIAGLLDPVIGLGAGELRLEAVRGDLLMGPNGIRIEPRDVILPRRPLASTETRREIVFAPSLGVVIATEPTYGFRFEVRDVVTRMRSREVAAGVTIRL